MTDMDKKAWAADMLRAMQEKLQRLPKKEDFDEPTRARIKAYLGPWPRALEYAGLKEARPPVNRKKHHHAK